jgi:hypothetical protein
MYTVINEGLSTEDHSVRVTVDDCWSVNAIEKRVRSTTDTIETFKKWLEENLHEYYYHTVKA